MMGVLEAPTRLFYDFDLGAQVPANHMLRQIDRFRDVGVVHEALQSHYSHLGRPSIDPELIVRMGGVFFRRTSCSKSEVINDLNRDVSNFFRIARKHHSALIEELHYQLTCRDEFERLKCSPANSLTDIERAAHFFYLQKCCYGGKITGQTFGVSADGRAGRFSSKAATHYIEALHTRLRRVVIESLPYADILQRYDRPTTLFYLDPPHWGCEADYGKKMFAREDFQRLASYLRRLRGRFIMSINDVPQVREVFAGFKLQEVKTTYTVSKAGPKRARELIISN